MIPRLSPRVPQRINRRLTAEQLEAKRLLTSVTSVNPPQNYGFAPADFVVEATFDQSFNSSEQLHQAIVARGRQTGNATDQSVVSVENPTGANRPSEFTRPGMSLR